MTVEMPGSHANRHRRTGLSDSQIAIAHKTAVGMARAVGKRHRLPPADVEDLSQDLMLSVLSRAHLFDAERSSWPTFSSLVMRHAAADAAPRIVRDQRRAGPSLAELSFDIAADLVVEGADGRTNGMPWHEVPAEGGHDARDLAIDVREFIADLPVPLRTLALLLVVHGPSEAERRACMSRAGFWRAVHELRMRFRMAGLMPRD